MKETKRFLVYYNESRELIGMREHHFDWEEQYSHILKIKKGGQI